MSQAVSKSPGMLSFLSIQVIPGKSSCKADWRFEIFNL